MYPAFQQDIDKMNEVYQLAAVVDADFLKRLQQFKTILFNECREIDELIVEAESVGGMTSADSLRIRTGIADLLADIIVYCASEAKRWDIPIGDVTAVVMSSNFSKLDSNGQPIKNPTTDKFEKGPNYWKPEPLIAQLLAGEITLSDDLTFSEFGIELPETETVPAMQVTFKTIESAVTPAAASQTDPVGSENPQAE